MSWTVYEHITPSGKRYIGITSKKPEHRWHNGRGYRKDTPFGKAIEKYKWENIQHNIVSTDLTEKDAKWLENYLICYYWTFVGFKYSKGYNCTLGGEGSTGFEHTEESKIKISETHKGKTPWIKGKHMSEESKLKISESHKGKTPWIKGKHMSEESKLKISETHKGKTPWNKGIKTGKPAWNRGIQHTEESKLKMSESHKGKTTWIKGKHMSEESRRKSSESHKGQIPWNIGIPHKEETKIRISMSKKGKPCPTKGMHRVYHEDGTFHMER